MPKALLHDGTVLDLPAGTTPEQAKAHVKIALNKKAKEKADQENRERSQREQKDEANHKEGIQATQAIAKSMVDGMGTIGKRLEQSTKALDSLGDIGASIEMLAKNIASLEKAVVSSTESIIKVLKAPRKIMHSAKGKPLGMQIEE